jgi:putative flavoprotein involved in K+ transport
MPDSHPARGAATLRATEWIAAFGAALAARDIDAVLSLFLEDCYWRDLLAFTWTLRTEEGRPALAALLRATLERTAPSGWRLEGEASEGNGVTEALLRFETAAGSGRGVLRLKDGKAWTLLTTLQELRGHEERRGPTRELGVQQGVVMGRRSWLERRAAERAALGRDEQPTCVIVGGGQNGIALAARLKRLGVPTLVLEQNARAGDSWRLRYRSLVLHDTVWYDHLPYLPFPDHWPVYIPKDQMGDWLESYVRIMDLDYWTGTRCRRAQPRAEGGWEVEVERDGEALTLRPRELVLATGMSGRPKLPELPGRELFRGTQHHSSRHPGAAGWEGRRCVVIGANNSAHDIAADLFEHGARVTMVQRSSTLVARSETRMKLDARRLYSEEAIARGIDTDTADLLFAATPYRVMAEQQKPVYREIRRLDADLYRRLEAAGFQLDFGEDDSGLYMKYVRRGSGYYIDVGASELVADGRIALRSRVEPAAMTATGLVLSDGSHLPADLVVWATGYEPMEGWVAELISAEVAARIGRCWGLGSDTRYDPGPWEGELRNMWKPTAQAGLWLQGGNLQQARHYSRYLALQIKARQLGLATPVFAGGAANPVT